MRMMLSALRAVVSGLQWVSLQVLGFVWRTSSMEQPTVAFQAQSGPNTDETDEGPLLFPTLMKASPVVPAMLFLASAKLSLDFCLKRMVDDQGHILPRAQFYRHCLEFLRTEAAFNLALCLWVDAAEFYRAEGEELPGLPQFLLPTVLIEMALNLMAGIYDLYAANKGPLRSNFLYKLRDILTQTTLPSIAAAPWIYRFSFNILYGQESFANSWLWMTLAGMSIQVPRKIVALSLTRLTEVIDTGCGTNDLETSPVIIDELQTDHEAETTGDECQTDNESIRMDEESLRNSVEEVQPLLSVATQSTCGGYLIAELPWTLLSITTTTVAWNASSWFGAWLYKQLPTDAVDTSALPFLEVAAGATIGVGVTHLFWMFSLLTNGIYPSSQNEIERVESKKAQPSLPSQCPPTPPVIVHKEKWVEQTEEQRKLHCALGISYMTQWYPPNYKHARGLLYKAALSKDGLAWWGLGFLYENGLDVKPSWHAAAFCYDRVDGEYAFIKLVLAVCYIRRLRRGVVSFAQHAVDMILEAIHLKEQPPLHNWPSILSFLERIAGTLEAVSANIILAFTYELGLFGEAIDVDRAKTCYQKVAERAEAWTLYDLGMMYQDVRWKDDIKAQYWLDLCVQRPEQEIESIFWYKRGALYRDSDCVQNYSEAIMCFERAREMGSSVASTALAKMYEMGLGCAIDLERAAQLKEEGDNWDKNRNSGPTHSFLTTEEDLPNKRKSRELNWNALQAGGELIQVQVLYDFSDKCRIDRLCITKGDILDVRIREDNWLYAVNASGVEGMVPRNAIGRLHAKKEMTVESHPVPIVAEEIKETGKLYRDLVSLGLWQQKQVVIKKVSEEASEEEKEDFKEEGLLMGRLDHPNIVKLLALTPDIPPKLIIEYMLYGSLADCLRKDKRAFSDEHRRNMALDIAQALRYLHDNKILHRDVKDENVLVSASSEKTYVAKLADFGIAVQCPGKSTARTSRRIGTLDWLSPELFNTHLFVYSTASDVYAYGILLGVLFTALTADAIRKYLSNPEQSSNVVISDDIFELIQSCCKENPDLRASMKEMVKALEKQLIHLSVSKGEREKEKAEISSSSEEEIAESERSSVFGARNGSPVFLPSPPARVRSESRGLQSRRLSRGSQGSE